MHPHVTALFKREAFTLIAGPCVVESLEVCRTIAEYLCELRDTFKIPVIFKASFDKANRTSHHSYRGPGVMEALAILQQIRSETQLPVLTDMHLPDQAPLLRAFVDVVQIPAFLCRQTDLLIAAAQSGLPCNVKKGQFLAPADMAHVVAKLAAAGAQHIAVTERGTCFGYGDLVVDMRSLVQLGQLQRPVIFDATHSVQKPGGADGKSGGDRTLAPPLARAAAAVGIDGLFAEVHPQPEQALSDGPNSLTLPQLRATLASVLAISQARKAAA